MTFGTELLVYCAMAAYALGFLFRNQFILRSLVLSGTCFYIAYYYYHPDLPLWDAIIASLVIGSATLFGLLSLFVDHSPLLNLGRHAVAYPHFKLLLPGDFRRLMARGTNRKTDELIRLTAEGEKPDKMHYVLNGRMRVQRRGRAVEMAKPGFIGEVAFLSGGTASATVDLASGARLISWDVDDLEQLLEANPRLARSFEAMMAQDMAAKVANATPDPVKYHQAASDAHQAGDEFEENGPLTRHPIISAAVV
ncbi:MAG: cyclic nucleotide-binding domain-containing protein [Pseudomonadota bacterium]